MKGNAAIIKHLNVILKNELTAINQYFLHSRILKDWGLEALGTKLHEESIEEMQHADLLIQRVLFLEGLPNLQDLNSLQIGENVKEIHESDLQGELAAKALYTEAAGYCDEVKDVVTRELFEKLIADEETHIDWLETQLHLIDQIGLQNYLQTQI